MLEFAGDSVEPTSRRAYGVISRTECAHITAGRISRFFGRDKIVSSISLENVFFGQYRFLSLALSCFSFRLIRFLEIYWCFDGRHRFSLYILLAIQGRYIVLSHSAFFWWERVSLRKYALSFSDTSIIVNAPLWLIAPALNSAPIAAYAGRCWGQALILARYIKMPLLRKVEHLSLDSDHD